MPVDHELYNRLYDTWWDENTMLGSMRNGLNPGRFGYFIPIRVLILQRQICAILGHQGGACARR
jgi:hypothetical protein